MKVGEFVGRFMDQMRQKRSLKAFFETGSILCEQCSHALPTAGISPFSFIECPKCSFKNFVPLRLGDYMLFQPLGAGGNASVYKAYRRDNAEHLYAAKILQPDRAADPETLEMFMFEVKVHEAVNNHPNIVTFYGHGIEEDYHYFIMDFVEGEGLKNILARKGKMDEVAALDTLAQVISAMKHVCKAGYLYRDLSAGNVIIQPNGHAMLIDFGLTLSLEDAAQPGTETYVDGTAEFLPPERIYHRGEDERSVIYSLGMLLYYMLTAEPLIKAKSLVGKAKRHVSDLKLALTPDLLPGCSAEMSELIAVMIETEPDDRFQTLEELEEAVNEIRARQQV